MKQIDLNRMSELLNGFIASSRLEMKAHTYQELIIGFVLGAVPQLLLLFLWL